MHRTPLPVFALLAATVLAAPQARAATFSVGAEAGCTHATLQAALDALATLPGDHRIKVRAGTHAVPDGMVYAPVATQGTLHIEGGYAACGDTAPGGDVNSDTGRSVFDGAGGLPRSVLRLDINGRVGSVQLRRIVLRGGDAFSTDETYNAGGGLAIRGNASVLLGLGASIRNNGAGRGGGVALIGSRIDSAEPMARADFYITEGAEISNNSAAAEAGGILCGGALPGDGTLRLRHGSIVHVNGSIANNSGRFGSAILCQGSFAGGGYQPRPAEGALAAVIGNSAPDGTIGCAIYASLDLIVPPGGGSERLLGAAHGSSGLLLVANNTGPYSAGLCVQGWGTRGGASPALAQQPRFVIQNAAIVNNTARHGDATLRGGHALEITATELAFLELRPSGHDTDCSFLGACVLLENNTLDGAATPGDVHPLVSGPLRLLRARVRDNDAIGALFRHGGSTAFGAKNLYVETSIVDNNVVRGDGSVLFLLDDLSPPATPSNLMFRHVTLTGNTHDRFLRLEDATTALLRGVVLHAPAPRLLRSGAAPAANLTLANCNHFTTLDDPGWEDATHTGDGDGAPVSLTGALAFDAEFTPPEQLRDKCSVPWVGHFLPIRDFHGRAMGRAWQPVWPTRLADIGAVEFVPPQLFADGFEAP